MDSGTFVQRSLADLPRQSGWLVLPTAPWQPQLRLLSGGIELRHDESYDWDNGKRPREAMAIIQLTISGAGRLRIKGREYDVGPGQTMILTAADEHRYWLPAHGRWEFCYLTLAGADAMGAVKHAITRGGNVQEFQPEGGFLPRIISTTRALVRNQITSVGQAAELTMCLLSALVAEIDARNSGHAGIERAKLLIRECLDRPPKLTELARRAGLSRSGFCHAFTATEGMAPGRWLQKERLIAAAERLRSGENAAQAAKSLGFTDAAYFGRAFRRHFGMPPIAWKRQFGR